MNNVRFEAADAIATVTIDRPKALNALILETIRTTASYAIQNKEGFIQKVRSISQVRQQEARGVTDTTIAVGSAFQDLVRNGHFTGVVG